MRITRPLFLLSAILYSPLIVFSQEPEKPKFEFKPYGYVNYEIIMDTYKSLDARDGELYFYPLMPEIDANNKDINKKVMLQMLSLTSRIGTKISGPDILGAKTSGLFEADFFATADAYARMLRVRHAIIDLKWLTSELIMGHYWHPIIVNEMIPSTVAFGAGTPFHPLNRCPQIRFNYNLSETFRVTAAALTQGYHRASGPASAQRYSGKPEIVVQASFGNRKTFLAGASADYKWLTPRLKTDLGFQTNKTIGSYMLNAFALGKFNASTIKAEVYYGQNPTNLLMIGGYGMKTGSVNAEGDYDLTNIKTMSTWLDFQQDIDEITLGFFAGYSKNLGADDEYTSLTIGTDKCHRNDDLSHIYRVAPRITYRAEALTFAFEYMITTAVYGKTFDNKRKVTDTMDPVSNHRFTLSATYRF